MDNRSRLIIFKSKKGKLYGIAFDYEDEIHGTYTNNVDPIPVTAEELGIDLDDIAEVYDIVKLIRAENLNFKGVRAWDEDGKAWYINTCEKGHIWVRDPKYDR